MLTRAANITLTQFPSHIYSDTPGHEKVIMHQALTTFSGWELDVRWEIMEREALGNETFEEMMAIKEEEQVALEIMKKEEQKLKVKQGLAK